MAAEQQGIMSLPQGGQEAAPQLSIDDSYDAISGALGDASPEASGQVQQLMSQLTPMLDQLTDEQLDMVIQVLQYLHDHPEEYAAKLKELVDQGVFDPGMLPEEYDPELLAVLGMVFLQAKKERQAGNSREMQAQMPMPPATMARGGIAEAARMVAGQGRNGDTMLAHITKDEARMLKKRGGVGTLNPKTGLPEYWNPFKAVVDLGKGVVGAVRSVTSAVADAVKPVLNTTVGKVLATAALATFLGPGAFGITGLGLGTAASMGLASGAITALGGGSLKDVLRAGATSYLAGALSPVVGSAAGSALGVTNSAAQAALGAGITGAGIGKLSGQSLADSVKSGLSAGIAAGAVSLANTPTAPVPTEGGAPVVDGQPLTPDQIREQMATGAGGQPINPTVEPPVAGQQGQNMAPVEDMRGVPVQRGAIAQLKGGISDLMQGNTAEGLQGIKGGIAETFAPTSMSDAQLTQTPEFQQARASGASYTEALKAASNANNPGFVRTYGPAIGAGLGIAALAGGFKPATLPPSAMAEKLAGTPGEDLIRATPSKYITQNMPGMTYDANGNIIGASRWNPGGTLADVRQAMPGTTSTFEPTFYTTPQGSVGQQQGGVFQPYNTGSMYNFMQQPYDFRPRYAADGGYMQAANGGPMNPYDAPSEGGMGDMGIVEPVQYRFGGGFLESFRAMLSGVPKMVNTAAAPALSAINDLRSSSPAPAPAPVAAAPVAAPVTTPPRPMQAPTLGTPSAGISSLAARMYPSLYNQQFQQQLMRPRGLASFAEGGYPRRTGQISGPGTEKSDSIPAMLSDGEFVMTAKAVRGAGKGDRRAGAKKMYALMHQLERNASRG